VNYGYGIETQFIYPQPGEFVSSAAPSAAKTGAQKAAAKGAGIDWGSAAVSAGASALTGIIAEMYAREREQRQREQELMREQSQNKERYGANQQNMMAQLMSNWNRALGV